MKVQLYFLSFFMLVLCCSSFSYFDLVQEMPFKSVKSKPANNILTEPEIAPDFVVETLDGKELALNELKGKVVYISFWASWCGPCIYGFNRYRIMRQDMEDLGVVMLNVSIDETKEAWHKGLENIPELGVQAFAKKDKTTLMHNYQLSSIPAYYIVDKKGNFAYLSNDPGRDILKEFSVLINE